MCETLQPLRAIEYVFFAVELSLLAILTNLSTDFDRCCPLIMVQVFH